MSNDLHTRLPSRMLLTIEDRAMTVGGLRVAFDPDDPTSVLRGYLRLIRAMRDQKRAPQIALRRVDIERLAVLLSMDGAEVLDRLAALMGVTVAQRIALGSLFAAGAVVIALVASSYGDTATASAAAAVAMVDVVVGIGTAAAGAEGLAPAVRLRPPASVTSVDNRSGCTTDPSEQVMSLTIPTISYACPVYAGGQTQIDAGFVTLVTDAGANDVLATEPGAPGTLWLAAHRSTHGAAFADVPDLADGALITVSSGSVTATYRVVGRSYFEVRQGQVVDANGNPSQAATWESIIRSDYSGNLAPRLVLQTCEGVNFRWMVYADLVT